MKSCFSFTSGIVDGPICKCDYSKQVKEGFEYKNGLKKIIDDVVESGRLLAALTE